MNTERHRISYGKSDLELIPGAGNQILSGNLDGERIWEGYNAEEPFFLSGNYLLFPWVNRWKDFSPHVQEDPNLVLLNSHTAIHGLVYSHPREFLEGGEDWARFGMNWREVRLEELYQISSHSVTLELTLKNLGKSQIPYSVGYHPYFWVPSCNQPRLKFPKTAWNWELDQEFLPRKVHTSTNRESLDLNNPWDHLFYSPEGVELQGDGIRTRKITSNLPYFQIYTPANRQSVAIEPMLTPANYMNLPMIPPILKNNLEKWWWKVEIS